MKYHVVFDVLQSGYKSWTFPTFVLIFFAIGIIIIILQKRKVARVSRLLPITLIIFSILLSTMRFISTYSEYTHLRDAMLNRTYILVGGKVTEFVPEPPEGHRAETFVVDGHRYSYSHYMVTAGFNQSQPFGGPIREGIQVRIADVDGKIARLEIAK